MAKNKSEFQYVLSAKCKRKDHVFTIINGEHIDLVGAGKEVILAARKTRPSKTVKYRKATEEDLRNFYELGLVKLADGTEISNQKIVLKVARLQPDTESTSGQ